MTDPVLRGVQVGAAVIAVAARFGVPAGGVRRVAGGVANDAYLLGDNLFLRVARPTSGSAADLCKKAVVIPLARGAGVRTAAIVDFDDSNSLIGVPYMVLEWIHGTDLAMLDAPRDRTSHALRQVGRELAQLHRVDLATSGPIAGITNDDNDGDPRQRVEHMAVEGRIHAETARWLLGWFDRLARRRPTVVTPVLLHGDVAAQNIVVEATTDRYLGIVDWGDACWADPARVRQTVAVRRRAHIGRIPRTDL